MRSSVVVSGSLGKTAPLRDAASLELWDEALVLCLIVGAERRAVVLAYDRLSLWKYPV